MGPRQTLLLPEDPPAPRGLPPPQTFFTPQTLPPLEDTPTPRRTPPPNRDTVGSAHCLWAGRFVGSHLFNWSQAHGVEVPLTPLPMSEHMAQHLVVRLLCDIAGGELEHLVDLRVWWWWGGQAKAGVEGVGGSSRLQPAGELQELDSRLCLVSVRGVGGGRKLGENLQGKGWGWGWHPPSWTLGVPPSRCCSF